MHNEYFRKVGVKSRIRKGLINHLIKDEGGTLIYHDFIVKVVFNEIISADPFLSALSDVAPFKSCVLIMDPMSVYNWHKDGSRGAGINMMVSPEGEPCLFKGEPISSSSDKITALHYEPDTYYVLNTQNDHMVVNNRDKPRLAFSLEFFEDRHGKVLSYAEVNEIVNEIEKSFPVYPDTIQ